MRKAIIVIVVAALALAGVVVYNRSGESDPPSSGAAGGGAPQSGGRGGRGVRPPMPVEFAVVTRAPVAEYVMVVGNLIGAATVQAVPKVNGRLQTVNVKLGDPVKRGQIIAKIEDNEIREQVRQAEASHKVAQATIRQRDADLKLAKTNLDRNRSLLERELLPRQTFDDTEARHQAALAQLDLARAQFEQSKARLDELNINLTNTVISSPVDGFVGKRFLDPGASVSPNVPVASLVDIRSVRLVANLVEKDVKRVRRGTPAVVEVDAFPGEQFTGTVSRIAPVFDPSTRTAEMEIEVPNPGFRLKPGMYARVRLTIETRPDALTVPRNALVDLEGKTGVFVAAQNSDGRSGAAADAPALTARFIPVETGIRAEDNIEIRTGLREGARVITTGAGALRDGDRIVAAGGQREGRRGPSAGSGQVPATGSGQGGRSGRGARGTQ